jgi:hypothetical protein
MADPGSAASAGQLACDDLTARVFGALYGQFDLRHVSGTYVAVPKGTPCFAAPSPGEIARQISRHQHPGPPEPDGSRLSPVKADDHADPERVGNSTMRLSGGVFLPAPLPPLASRASLALPGSMPYRPTRRGMSDQGLGDATAHRLP